MSLLVTAAVLVSAVLHAGWNVLAKAIPDRLAASTLLAVGMGGCGLVGVLVFPAPAAEAWPFLVVSVLLETGYFVLLTAAYQHADFATAYPLARGTAVLVVSVVSATVLGEHLTWLQAVGIALIVAALLSLVALDRPGGSRRLGLGLAVATGLFIAAYSLVDGVGVRRAGSPEGFAAWLFLGIGLLVPATCAALGGRRPAYRPALRENRWRGLAGGVTSAVAFGIVLRAQSRAPLSLVSALRETGVLLAGVLGYLFFREPWRTSRTVATAAAVLGVIALNVSSPGG